MIYALVIITASRTPPAVSNCAFLSLASLYCKLFQEGISEMYHSRKAALILASALGACLLAAHPALAQVVPYVGTDLGAQPGSTFTNSNAAAAQFDTAAGALGTESLITFESTPVGNFTSLNVAPGVTMVGAGANNTPQVINNTPAYPVNPAVAGFNTTPGGSHYVGINGGTVQFVFAAPIQAFGAYFTGFQPTFFQSTVTFSDGTNQSLNVPSGDAASGGAGFLGFTDAGKSISQITVFSGPPPANPTALFDFAGLDDVRFVPAAVPEASTTVSFGLLLALGLGGVLVARKRIVKA